LAQNPETVFHSTVCGHAVDADVKSGELPPTVWFTLIAFVVMSGTSRLEYRPFPGECGSEGDTTSVRLTVGIELDVVVDVDLGGLPAADLVARGRQRLERRGVEQPEGARPSDGKLLEGSLVRLDEELKRAGVTGSI
jgi:hypothetical protein